MKSLIGLMTKSSRKESVVTTPLRTSLFIIPALLGLLAAMPTTALGSESQGLLGLYYKNRDLTGLAAIHVGETVGMSIAGGKPDAAVGTDDFSIRWVGQLNPTLSGAHTLYLRGDDGIRLRVNGQLLIDKWKDQSATEYSTVVTLTAGTPVTIEVEFYERGGDAVCQLSWLPPGQTKVLIPLANLSTPADSTAPSGITGLTASYVSDRAATLTWTAATDDQRMGAYAIFRNGTQVGTTYETTWSDTGLTTGTTVAYSVRPGDAVGNQGPLSAAINVTTTAAPANGTGTGLAATYFSDINLTTRAKQRTDATLNFNWGSGTPDPAVPKDNFTAMWLGEVQARYSETYTFFTSADDHVRLWVGNQLLIDTWAAKSSFDQQATIVLQAGQRYPLRADYWEQGGNARVNLQWQSLSTAKQIVPATQLYPAVSPDPMQNDLLSSALSRTSPAWCEGMVVDVDTVVTASIGGQAVPVTRAGVRRWFADNASASGKPRGVVLTPGQATTVQVTTTRNGQQTQTSHQLTWQMTDVTGSSTGTVFTVRPGDSLLITATKAGGAALAIDSAYNGSTFTTRHSGVPGQGVVVPFAAPGTFVVAARVDDTIVGTATVQVPVVDLLGPVAGQVNYRRTKDVTITPVAAADGLSFTSNEDWRCEVAVDSTIATGRRLGLRALYEGDYVVQARVGGPHGAILTQVPFDDFVASTTASTNTILIEQLPDGTDVVQATLSMRPLVRGLDFTLNAFVAGVTFEDSTTTMVISTDSFTEDTASGVGTYHYILLMAPGSHVHSCHTITIKQQGVRISR